MQAQTNSIDLDAILAEIGERGRYQIAQYGLLSLLVVLTSIPYSSFIFTAGQLNYRCRIPELDSPETAFAPIWLPIAVPYTDSIKPEQCLRYPTIPRESDEYPPAADYQCESSVCFNSSSVERCHDFVYETDEVTLVNEFNITCPDNDWRLAIIGTLGYAGQLIALPICAFLSDRHGRRPIIVATVLLSSLCGLLTSWSTSYAMFVAVHAATSLSCSGTYMAIYVLAIELAGPTTRVLAGTLITVLYSCSMVLTGVLAMWFTDFRALLRVLYAPMAVLLPVLWLLPESSRWLVTKGRVREARQHLLRAARFNRRALTVEALAAMLAQGKEAAAASDDGPGVTPMEQASNDDAPMEADSTALSGPPEPGSFHRAVRSRTFLLRLANCVFCWTTVSFIYYGMNVHSTALPGNKYVNYILVNAVDIPAALVASALMGRLGRRRVICAGLVVGGLACVAAELIGDAERVVKLAAYAVGKSGVSLAFTVLYVFVSELFPTALRQSCMNACIGVGSAGTMMAPLTTLLVHTWSALPLLLFGGSALLSSALVLLLPETIDARLPDTVQEAEDMGNKPTSSVKKSDMLEC